MSNTQISYGDSIRQTQMSTSTLNDVLETIQINTDLSEKISKIRTTADKDERGKLNFNFPILTLVFLKTTNIKMTNSYQQSSWLSTSMVLKK